MPAARSTRSVRRKAATRNILGALDGNEKSASTAVSEAANSSDAIQLPEDFDGSDPSTIRLLLEDISREVRKRQDSIVLLADQAKSEQQEAVFVHKMKIQRSVRDMTVRDFNAKFGCDLLDLVLTGGGMLPTTTACAAGKKRDRPGGIKATEGAMALETPAPKEEGVVGHAPGTTLRTVRRGEAMFSANGSPVDKAEEGDLVATVCKKHKGNAVGSRSTDKGAAVFDINVGDGRYVSLTDPGTVEHLDQEMKNTAMAQLKILQDQMAGLMAQLGN